LYVVSSRERAVVANDFYAELKWQVIKLELGCEVQQWASEVAWRLEYSRNCVYIIDVV
jgi:hypothetical protein